jgi:signal transduction histidine kinase/ligand-binding sensor domain-containing protein
MPGFILIRLQQLNVSRRISSIQVRVCLVGLILICLPQAIVAQFQFDSWSTDDGLPQNSIQAILQTRDGYLWLTTSDGLVRFDGVRFTVFERGATNGFDSNRLTALFEDREGTLWIGTEDRGIIRYRNGVFTSYTTEDGLPDFYAASFREDKAGNLLVKTLSGIVERRGERFAPYPVEYDLEPAPGNAAAGSFNHRAFSFYDSNGVHRYEEGRYKTYRLNERAHPRYVYQDQQETLWITSTDNRLFRLKADSSMVEEIKIKNGLSGRYADAVVYDDRQGSIWLSTPGGDLSRLSEGSLTIFAESQGYSGKRVTRFYEDREGYVWLGTFNQGLHRMSRQIISAYVNAAGSSTNNIYTTYEDHEGTIWIGTWGSGLSSFRDGKFTNYANLTRTTGSHITALFEDREKSLWVGSNTFGLSRRKDGQWTTFTRAEGLSNDSIFAVLQDRTGSLWIGTANGLNRYKDGVFTVFTTKEGLAHQRVQAIYEDRAGYLWLGTLGGVSQFKDGVFTSITEKDGLSSNHIRSIYEDSDGAIWIGTYDSGLNRLKDGKITRYTRQDGLFNNGVFQILEDAAGNFWISCNRGVYRVNKKELNDFAGGKTQTITSISFDKGDGMPSSECNGGYQPAGLKSRDGKLLFPTQGGLAVVDTEAVRTSTRPPPVVIEGIILDHQSVPISDRLEISPGKENLEIQYTGLSFIKPQLIRFRYKLAGLNDDWIEAGTRRTAYYSYVPPGEYFFTVIAANSDGVWNNSGASLKIIVYPPFWRTRWFLALSALALLGMVFLVYEYRVRGLKRANALQESFSRQLIESQERERKRIAGELHDSLGQSLAIIKSRAALSLTQPEDHDQAFEQLAEISDAANYAMDEVREIAYDLRPYQLDRLGLTKALETLLKKVSQAGGLSFSYHVDQLDRLLLQESEINLYRVVQESVGNIIKHAQATEASVMIHKTTQSIEIEIRDNGKGFDPEAPISTEPGRGGFGLVGISERTRMLDGQYNINSTPERGTTINIKLPHKGPR